MKLLFVTTRVLDYPKDVIKVISFNLIKALQVQYSYKVDLIVICNDSGDYDVSEIKKYCSFVRIGHIKPQNYPSKLKNLFRLVPNHILKMYDPSVAEAIDKHIANSGMH